MFLDQIKEESTLISNKPDILGILPTLVIFWGTVAGALAIDFRAVRFVGLTAGGCISGCFGALSSFLLSFGLEGDFAC